MESKRRNKSSIALYNKSHGNSSSTNIIPPPPKQPWRKLLWLNQDYPDNYVDSSFLSQLKRNSTVTKYFYWKLVNDFSLINLHLFDTSIVIVIFFGLYNNNWSPYLPTLIFTNLTIIGYFIWNLLSSNHLKSKDMLSTFKSSIIIVFTILTLSPVLRSLTESTSSDSIWALSSWLTILNIICHNYEFDITKNQNYKSSVLSTNILFANVIVLSSRLPSNISAFCFILISIQIYGLFPVFQYGLRKNLNYKICTYLSLIYFLIVSLLIAIVIKNNIIILTWFSINFFIIFFCPGYFLFLQQYKNELQGPWDPAKPKIN